MKAMVLAAGLGTRLRPLTYELPKPMVPVLGQPVMGHDLRLLAAHGFDDVIANLHYFPDQIKETFGDGSGYGVRLAYRFEPELLGTAGGVRNVRDHFGDETFLIVSGDALTDVDLTALWRRHREHGGIATLTLKRVEDTSEYGVVIIDEEGRIQGFQEKPDPAEALSDLGNCGIYVFEPEIFDYFPDRPFVDWAQDVFPALLDQDVAFYGHEIDDYWNDVGSMHEYRQGNFDALAGVVKLHAVPDSLPRAQVDDSAIVEGQVYIGDSCRIEAGVRLTGPVVLGDGCLVGEGSAIRESIVWPRTELPPGTVLIDAVTGTRPLAEKLLPVLRAGS
jgi:mannose-1-phosphate guanylyltransferase/mannose-1-phosphate guanylyltransferase/phosphomannomutase